MTVFELRPDVVTPDDYADAEFKRKADLLYETTKGGLLTATPASMVYLPASRLFPVLSSLAEKAREFTTRHPKPSRDYILNSIRQRQFSSESSLGQVEFILDHGNYSPVFKSESGKKYATMMQVLQYPYSRGSIHIDPSAAASGKVIIDPKYYQGEGAIDYEVMVQAQAFGDLICRTAPLSNIVVKRVYPQRIHHSTGDNGLAITPLLTGTQLALAQCYLGRAVVSWTLSLRSTERQT